MFENAINHATAATKAAYTKYAGTLTPFGHTAVLTLRRVFLCVCVCATPLSQLYREALKTGFFDMQAARDRYRETGSVDGQVCVLQRVWPLQGHALASLTGPCCVAAHTPHRAA